MSDATQTLLGAFEPGPFELIRPTGRSNIVLVCDHASNLIPERLHNLGLDPDALASHIAWDMGAAALARQLSSRLDATLILSNYSRLVIDCNRAPESAESIVSNSAGITVPGNSQIDKQERSRRRRTLFEPYQQAIASILARRDRDSARLLSIHSFTPVLDGIERPWAIGVCYEQSEDWARQMLTGLRTRLHANVDAVGDNQPYDVDSAIDYTLPRQGQKQGITSLMLELRQDKLADAAMVKRWCDIIAGCCQYSSQGSGN